MSSWSGMPDETKLRLRASCNACNESKVRCSQRKPTCTRCERNGIDCVYGLSRRTHKDAPPISIPPSQRGRGHSRPAKRARSNTNTSTTSSNNNTNNSKSISNSTTRVNGYATPEEPTDMHDQNANLLADYMFPMSTDNTQLLDFSSFVPENTSNTSMAPGLFSTTGAEYVNSTTMAPGQFSTTESEYGNAKPWGRDCAFAPNFEAIEMGTCWALNGQGECTCHMGVTELLVSMRGGGTNNDSLDAQLAKLKQCIAASEMSMGCAHAREDSEPIHIMAVAMLIGYVIDDFKMLANESSLRKSSSMSSMSSLSSSAAVAEMATFGNPDSKPAIGGRGATPPIISLGGLMEPRLSWGVLELEEDDEMDLRQRLYLLSFRKLERLLSQLTLYLRDLHNTWAGLPDPSRHTAFVIACDYTRLWLEKKAGDVKRLLSVPGRNEPMNFAMASL